MNYLEVLSQPPVLGALVPHLDGRIARRLFSTCRALHQALKNSAGLRYAVWLLERKRWCASTEWWFGYMMKGLVRKGDLHAARLACDLPAPVSDRAYMVAMDAALSEAVRYRQYKIIELIIGRQKAEMDVANAYRALIAGNLDMVKYLFLHHPEPMKSFSTNVVELEDGTLEFRINIDGHMDHFRESPPRPGHLAIHEWMLARR